MSLIAIPSIPPIPSLPFPAALKAVTRPNTCGVMNLLASGQGFIANAIRDANLIRSQLNAAASSLNALPGQVEGILLSQVQSLANNLTAIATGAVNTLVSHMTAHLTNLVQNLTIAIAQSGAQQGLSDSGCSLPSAPPTSVEPCGNMQALFGSVMGLGGTLVSQMADSLSGVTGSIGQMVNGIGDATAIMNTMTAAIGNVAGIATKMTSMVTAEVNQMAAAIKDMITFSAANTLFQLIGHPCAQSVLGNMASKALLDHLGFDKARAGTLPPIWADPPDDPPAIVDDIDSVDDEDNPLLDDDSIPPGIPTSDSLTFGWTNPSTGEAPFSYQPEYRPAGSSDWIPFGDPIEDISVTLTGLGSNTQYEFRVITTNAFGTSTSPIATASTLSALAGAPSQATDLTLSAITTNSVDVAWTAPTDGNQPFSYQPRYRAQGAYFWTDYGNPISQTSLTITGLGTGSDYDIEIVTLNDVSSSMSAVVSFTTLGLVSPSAVPTTPAETPATDIPPPNRPIELPLAAYIGTPSLTSSTQQALFLVQYKSFTAAMGRAPKLLNLYLDATQLPANWPVQASLLAACWQTSDFLHPARMTPIIGLPMASSAVSGSQAAFLQAIIDGTYDDQITGVFDAFAQRGYTQFYLRPGYEMNGNLAWQLGTDTALAALFVTAFQRIAQLAHDYSTASIKVVWNPVAGRRYSSLPFMTYYPGDAAVDVIGFDSYGGPNGEDPTTVSFDTSNYTLSAAGQLANSHGKTLAIGETGIVQDAPATLWTVDFINALGKTLRSLDVTVEYVALWDSTELGAIRWSNPYDNQTAIATAYCTNFGASVYLPDVALGLSALTITPSLITLSWQGILQPDDSAPTVRYQPQYRIVGASHWLDATGTVETRATIENLTAGTAYEFRVMTINDSGSSICSPITVTTETIRQVAGRVNPSMQVSGNSAPVLHAPMNAAVPIDSNLPISGVSVDDTAVGTYVCTLSCTAGTLWLTDGGVVVPGTGTPTIVFAGTYNELNAVLASLSYFSSEVLGPDSIQITLVNPSGETSTLAIAITVNPAVSPPSQVIGLHMTGHTATTLTVAWSVPISGTAPLFYQVQHRLTGTVGWTVWPQTADTQATISGLSSLSSYDIEVIASNNYGNLTSGILVASTTA